MQDRFGKGGILENKIKEGRIVSTTLATHSFFIMVI